MSATLRRRPFGNIISVAGVLLTTTIATALPAEGSTAAALARTARKLWTHTDYAPVTEPVAVSGRVVLYTASRGTLSLRAVDPRSGRTLWARPATRSYSTAGAYTRVAVSPGTAYYYRPVGPLQDGLATLVAIDVVTGKDKWVQPGRRAYVDMPDVCRMNRPLLCMTAYEADRIALRVDGVTGQVRRIPAASGRRIGEQLYNSESRNPELIERVDTVSGRRIWSLDLRTLSPSRPITTDRGWSWELVDGVYVGWVAFDTKEPFDGPRSTFDLAKQQTFGVRASDGRVLWRAAGMLSCLDAQLDRPLHYRCVGKGVATYTRNTALPVISSADVTLERFDVQTGRAIWRRHVGTAPSLLGSEPPATVSGHLATIPVTAAGSVTINMVDGTLATLPAPAEAGSSAAVGWCEQDSTWHSTTPLPSATGSGRNFPRFGLVQPCTSAGLPAAATTEMPPGPTVLIGTVLIWSSKDGLHAVSIA